MSDLVKIARARIDDTQRTHWVGCERDHRECLIQRMADEIERLRADLNGLVMLVVRKYPGETRYETAARYIREIENAEAAPTSDAARGKA